MRVNIHLIVHSIILSPVQLRYLPIPRLSPIMTLMNKRYFIFFLLVILSALPLSATDIDDALAAANDLIAERRFGDVIELLKQFESLENDEETTYILNAEIGRCHFHLGEYKTADKHFRIAVRLHPERIESALYLEATSFLLGDHAQAMKIFSEIVKSGAADLYIAVTLPGERQFLANADAWKIMEAHTLPVDIDLSSASVLGVSLGEERPAVILGLGAGSVNNEAKVLTAQAGPRTIWAFSFDEHDQLSDILLHSENLVRYTPYRLKFANGLDWRLTPSSAINMMGIPNESSRISKDELQMRWEFETFHLTLSFGPAKKPAHPEHPDPAAMLKMIHLSRITSGADLKEQPKQ